MSYDEEKEVSLDEVQVITREFLENENNTYSKICRKAIVIINKQGWRQGHLLQGKTVCILGALGEAGINYIPFVNKIIGKMQEITGHKYLFEWNDMLGRTKEEVISLLNKTADYFDK